MDSFLIAGLGNIGDEYAETRHNIGFKVVDALAKKHKVAFDERQRYGAVAEFNLKGKRLILLKPSTYMNLSGKAVRYWQAEGKVMLHRILVVVDDLALPFGSLRLKGSGSDGGHNGLKSLQEVLNTSNYPRLRFGIENNFPKGGQVDYVLGEWTAEEKARLAESIDRSVEIIESFCLMGIERSMNLYNKKG